MRGSDGISSFEGYEVVGRANSDDWGRCRACGSWFWFTTDLGDKYQYVDQKELDRELALRAFLKHDIGSIVELLLRYKLPHGPVWTLDSARLELLRQLAPDAGDNELASALKPADRSGPWGRVRRILEARRQADREAPAVPALDFTLDIDCDSTGIEETIEMPGALLLYRTKPPFEILRIDASGTAVRIMLPDTPRMLASNRQRTLFAIPSEAGEVVLTFGSKGEAHSFPPVPGRYVVQVLDDGWWLFTPLMGEPPRWVEMRRPDATEAAKLLMTRETIAYGYPPPPRRFGAGWAASGVLDANGETTSLSIFDEGFQLQARSEGPGEPRLLTPTGEDRVMATTLRLPGTVEMWVRRGSQMVRAWHAPLRSAVLAGGGPVLLWEDELTGVDMGGAKRWTVRHEGAFYLHATGDLVIAYGGSSALVVDARTGAEITRIELLMEADQLDVLQGHGSGALYLRDDRYLWIVHEGAVRCVALPFEAALVSTARGAALLGDPESGRHVLIGPDGRGLGGFEAKDTGFSVLGTRAGPYVLGPRRLRVAAFMNL